MKRNHLPHIGVAFDDATSPSDMGVIAILIAIFLAFCLVGEMDYNDELQVAAEREAYTKAIVRCANEDLR